MQTCQFLSQTTLVVAIVPYSSPLPPVTCSGAGQFHEAEQYLSQAQWVVLTTPSPHPGIQSQLHRNLGLLALAKGQLSEARRHLAEDIYQSSTAFGPEAVQTAGGYFHLATAFAGEDRPDVVLSLHNEVHVWVVIVRVVPNSLSCYDGIEGCVCV